MYVFYLAVLIGSDGNKLCFREAERVLGSAPHQHISGLDHMNPRLVSMQRVEDDLQEKNIKYIKT